MPDPDFAPEQLEKEAPSAKRPAEQQGPRSRVATAVKTSGYEGGSAKLSPDSWKPPAPGKDAVGELEEFLKKRPSPQEVGRLLARMEAQGRVGAFNASQVRATLEKACGPEFARSALGFTGLGVIGNTLTSQPKPVVQKPAAQPEASSGGWGSTVKGWFKKGAEKVGAAYHGVMTTASATYQKTKTALSNAWDVVSSTRVGYADGNVVAQTDMDELQDFLPGTRAIVDLDKTKKADNRVTVVFDTKAKVLSVSAATLSVRGLHFKGLSTGPATLKDVFVRITGVAAERMHKEKEQGKPKGGDA